MAGVIQVGQRFYLDGVSHRIMRLLGKDEWLVENLSTGRIQEISTDDLLSKWEAGELQFPGASEGSIPSSAQQTALKDAAVDAFMQSYPQEQIDRAKAKLAFIRKLKDIPITAGTITPLIQEIWSDKSLWNGRCIFASPPHFTTFARWLREYRDAGDDIRALIDKHCEKGNTKSRYGDEVEEMADDVIASLYMTLERRSIQECLEFLRGRISKLNQMRLASEQIARPSYKYLKGKIKALPAYDVCLARYGKRIADLRFRASGNGVITETPLERAAIDHCRIDLIAVDDATGLPLGRPWLTLVLDEHSRYVLGYYLGFEEPSLVSVARALRSAIMPKTALLTRYPKIIDKWEAWGIPHLLIANNGLELHGTAVETAIKSYGMLVQYCPRKKPWYKGKIERFFRTLNIGLLSGIPGKTFSNIFEKADYDPVKYAVVGLDTLREIVITWIVDIYHRQLHRGIGKTPAEAWRDSIGDADQWLPPSSTVLDSAFSRRDNRILSHKGIECDGLFYNSADMQALREEHGTTLRVEVRMMDEDMGYLFVVAPDGRTIVKVPALDMAYANGMTRWQHKVCRRYQRRMLDDEGRDISLMEAKERIRELIQRDAGFGKRKTRKKQARFMEQGDGSLQIAAPSSPAYSVPFKSQDGSQNRLGIFVDSSGSSDPVEQKAMPLFTSRRVPTTSEGCA
ncbi:MAG: Mu transposase C-terminal domain-containing protein [Thermomonas sp.]